MSADRFQPRLESLRGLAALMVAYFHALAWIRMDGWLELKIRSVLNVAGNGSAGVVIFFVLSGYVLGRSLDFGLAGRPVAAETVRFIVKRVFRIWPAMAVCLAGCWLWVRVVHVPRTFEAASADYALYWREGAPLGELARDVLFLQTFYNPVTWTLQVEMIAGLVFVPLWWICRRSPPAGLALTAAWAAWFLSMPQPSRTGYVYMLLLGLYAGDVARLAGRHLGPRALGLCLGLAFLGCGIGARWPRATVSGTAFLESVFAFLIVAFLVASHDRVRLRLFDHPITRLLGRLSYSFYLWHFVVVYLTLTLAFASIEAAVWMAWPNAMATALFIVSTLATVPAAWLSYGYVEQPMLRLGKALVRRRVGARAA